MAWEQGRSALLQGGAEVTRFLRDGKAVLLHTIGGRDATATVGHEAQGHAAGQTSMMPEIDLLRPESLLRFWEQRRQRVTPLVDASVLSSSSSSSSQGRDRGRRPPDEQVQMTSRSVEAGNWELLNVHRLVRLLLFSLKRM